MPMDNSQLYTATIVVQFSFCGVGFTVASRRQLYIKQVKE